MEADRKLTKKERNRISLFEKTAGELKLEGYNPHIYTINIAWANIMSMLLMTPFVILAVIFWRISLAAGDGILHITTALHPIMLFILLALLAMVHELLHGMTWALFAEGHFRSIEFGVFREAPALYCSCLVPLKKWQYLVGIIMPTLILGFGMAAIGIATKEYLIFFYSILMMYGGGAGFYASLRLLRHREKNKDAVYIDHPIECGYVIFEKEVGNHALFPE